MMTFSTMAVFSCLMASPVPAHSGTASKAIEILRQANEAATKLTAIAYEGEYHGEEGFANKVHSFQGKVLAERGPDDRRHRVRVDGTAVQRGTKQAIAFTFAMDGQRVYSIDRQAKVFASGPINVTGPTVGNPLFQPKYLHESPFAEEASSNAAEYQGVEEIKGVRCDVVRVKAAKPQDHDVKFFFGEQDHLLRRMETTVQLRTPTGSPVASGRLVFTATALDARPTIPDSIFQLKCPEGFRAKPWQTPPTRSSGLLPTGSEAPDWTLTTPDGKTVTLRSLRGKVVMLDFWATWCGPCKMAMPHLQKLHERFKDKPVAIFGVNCRERRPNANPIGYIKSKGYTYPQLINGNQAADAYRVRGIPCFYIIGPDGKILDARSGFHPQMDQAIIRIIEQALKNAP